MLHSTVSAVNVQIEVFPTLESKRLHVAMAANGDAIHTILSKYKTQ